MTPITLTNPPSTALMIWALAISINAVAEPAVLPSGDEIARRVDERDEGTVVYRVLKIELIDRRGKRRTRITRGYRKDYGDEKRTILYFDRPRNVKGTALLTYDYRDPKREDDQWLYLPAMRKVRRISAADRGDYFLGTDFTYEDIKNETKGAIEDFDWKTIKEEKIEGKRHYVVDTVPINETVRKELGYGRVRRWVDAEIWMVRKAEYRDVNGNPLKSIRAFEIQEIQQIWTAHRLEAHNHKTGHRTIFTFSDIDYSTDVAADVFTRRALRRGL